MYTYTDDAGNVYVKAANGAILSINGRATMWGIVPTGWMAIKWPMP